MDAKSGSKGNIRVCFYNPLTDEETLIQTISVPNYEDYETKQSIIFKCKDGEIRLYGYDSLSSTSKVYIKNIVVEVFEPLVRKHQNNPAFRRMFNIRMRE